MKKCSFILFAASLLLCQSCATILGSKTKFKINKDVPVGAKVYIDNVYMGTTPLTFKYKDEFGLKFNNKKIEKKVPLLEIKLEGFKIQTIPLKRKLQIGYLILDSPALFPIAIDFITGSIFKYYPNEIKVDLQIEEEKK
jgi:hypothetical protein